MADQAVLYTNQGNWQDLIMLGGVEMLSWQVGAMFLIMGLTWSLELDQATFGTL